MNTKIRILTLVLAIAMMLSVVGVYAFAADGASNEEAAHTCADADANGVCDDCGMVNFETNKIVSSDLVNIYNVSMKDSSTIDVRDYIDDSTAAKYTKAAFLSIAENPSDPTDNVLKVKVTNVGSAKLSTLTIAPKVIDEGNIYVVEFDVMSNKFTNSGRPAVEFYFGDGTNMKNSTALYTRYASSTLSYWIGNASTSDTPFAAGTWVKTRLVFDSSVGRYYSYYSLDNGATWAYANSSTCTYSVTEMGVRFNVYNCNGEIFVDDLVSFRDDYITMNLVGGGAVYHGVNECQDHTFVDDACTTCGILAVASIGDVKFADIQQAIDAVKSGDTILLLQNVSVYANHSYAVNYTKAESFILDLNGKTLSSNLGSVIRFNIDGNGIKNTDVEITIKNGKVVGYSNTSNVITAITKNGNKLTLNLEDLDLENDKAASYAVNSQAGVVVNANNVNVLSKNGCSFFANGGEIILDNCSATTKGSTASNKDIALFLTNSGKLTVNSGTYTAAPASNADKGLWVVYFNDNGGTLTINGGEFSGVTGTTALGIIAGNTKVNDIVNINGGSFTSNGAIFDSNRAPVATLAGGTYSANPVIDGVTLADGFEVLANADGTFSVHAHSYNAVVTAPTCVADGYTTYTCSCGDSYVDNKVDALGHTAGAAADCENAQKCTVCGAEIAPALGHTFVEGSCTICGAADPDYVPAEIKVSTLADLIAALAADNNLPIIITATIEIPAGETVVLDLNGKTVAMSSDILTTVYALDNKGTLTLKDSKNNGSISSRGIYNYGNITVESGTYNAMGTNGGAAIFNYSVAYIYGGTFTSIGGYSLNNQSGASMTIGSVARSASTGVTVTNGIYNSGATLTINSGNINNSNSGRHTIYAFDSNVTINGGNLHNYNSGNSTIMAAGNSAVDINGGNFTINIVDASSSYLLDAQNTATYDISDGNFVGGIRAQGGTSYAISGGTYTNEYGNYNIYTGGSVNISGGTFDSESAKNFAESNVADGFELNENGEIVEVANEIKVATLEDLLAALAADNDLPIVITSQIVIAQGETVILDLNGKTVNSVFNGSSTTNHIYALSNKGTLTITDTSAEKSGSINSRGIYNYGSLTLEAGAINAIDGNGGYAVNNESGSTFVMNGGVVAATYEDDYQSSSGGYDATALEVPAGCTATLNGGVINSVCDFTFAISSSGTLNIPASSTIVINGSHGAIAVQGGKTTINAGTFTIPADEYSRTDNVVYVSGGSIVINGGTFIGDSDIPSGGSCVCDAVGGVTINGGSFSGSSGGDVWGTTGTVITGGQFANLTEKQHIADGFELDENGNVVESVSYLVFIGTQGYETLAEALAAAKTMTGDVTVEILDKVTLSGPINGSFDSITFVGKDTDAEIYIDLQGYIEAAGEKLYFADLTLSKVAGGHIANAGFMNLAFGIYNTDVTYTNCVFANGAYASGGNATFIDCTFYRSHDRYGMWVYGDVDALVDGCTFADIRGIKLYSEGMLTVGDLIVKNTDFSAVDNKPAIVLTSGNSVTLEGNTYNATKGVFELDLDGVPNGTLVTSDVPPTCVNDNGVCGVIVDGKIYTTVAQAAEVATSGSTVTLLHNSLETVELAEGVVLDKNGFDAAGVTVAVAVKVAEVNGVQYATLAEAFAAVTSDSDTVIILADVTEDLTGAYLRGNITTLDGANVTITLTNADWVYCPYSFVLGESITLNVPALFYYAGGSVIKGTVITGAYYQRYAGTKLYVEGTMTVTSETFILRYTDDDANAGIYVNGGTLNASVIYFYQGTISGTNGATINAGVYWQTNETDGQGSANLVLDNATLNITVNEHVAKITGTSTATIKNGSNVTVAGGYQGVRPSIDSTSKFVDAQGNNIFKDPAASVNGVEYETLAEAFAAVQAGETITLLADLEIVGETFTIPAGKSLTLDMNGKKITATDNKAANVCYELFYIYGELTVIGNGTIELTSTSNDTSWAKSSTIFHNRGGVLTIENGTYKHLGGTYMAYVIDNNANSFGDAVTTIKDGTFDSAYIAIRNRMEYEGGNGGGNGIATLNVEGGTITGVSRAIWAQASSSSVTAPARGAINVSGGNIGLIDTARSAGALSMTTITGGTVASFKGEVGELVVNGGTLVEATILTAAGQAVDYAIDANGAYVAAVAKVGTTNYADLQQAIAAAQNGETITLLADAEISATTNINKSITIDGNGHKLTQSADFKANGANVVFDIFGGATVTFKNLTFDAIKTVGIIRTVSANLVMDNCTVQNCAQTVSQGMLRLACGNATITNSKFLNNSCSMVLTFGYDAANDTDVLLIDGCTFEGNTCGDTAVVYFASGDYGKVTNTKFIDNSVSAAGNAATLYFGWGEGFEISGCLFDGNDVTTSHATTKRFASAIFADGCKVENNIFLNNTATRNGEAIATVVAIGAYYGEASVNGNYWNGGEPAFTVEYDRKPVAKDYYYTALNADGTINESSRVEIFKPVASVNGVGYETLAEALAAAVDGDVIVLGQDASVTGLLAITNAVKIDLNGNKLTADSVVFFDANGGIIDSGIGTGALIVPQGRIMANQYASNVMPIWSDDVNGYIFLEMKSQAKDVVEKDADSFVVEFRPGFVSPDFGVEDRKQLLGNGALDNDLTFVIRINFISGGKVAQHIEVVISDELVGTVYTNNTAFKVTINGATDAFDSYEVVSIVKSNTGIAYSGVVGTFVPAKSSDEE